MMWSYLEEQPKANYHCLGVPIIIGGVINALEESTS